MNNKYKYDILINKQSSDGEPNKDIHLLTATHTHTKTSSKIKLLLLILLQFNSFKN